MTNMNLRGMTNMNKRKSDRNRDRACRTERIPQAARTIACALALLAGGTLSAGDLVLVSPGRRTCAVVVDGEVFSPFGDADKKRAKEAEARKRLRESAKDLAATLEKVTGGSVAVVTNAALLAGRTPVYVGAAAERVFGKVLPFPGDWRKFTPSAAPSAFGRPIAFEATDAAKAGKNVLDVFAVREAVNEVGTGGLLGPVTVYAEK